MRRIHLFEFGDQPWVPRMFRRYLHELLQWQTEEIYAPVLPLMSEWIRANNVSHIIDLASGAGGPWPMLWPSLSHQFPGGKLTFSDLHPPANPEALWHEHAVSIMNPDTWPPGGLTLFTALHHLRPPEVAAFFRMLATQNRPLFIAEFTERRLGRVLGMLLSPLLVWLHTPNVRPRSFGRWLFTYLIPVVPIIYLWDGAVSHMRSYTVAELRALAEKTGLKVEIKKVPNEDQGLVITVLTKRVES